VTVSVTPPGPGSQAPRLVALVVGLAGVTAIAVVGTLQARPSPSTAALCVAAGMILAVRFALALRADRRYAELLEREVAAQTRSLMGSLSATAAAERNLRLLMESVPEAVVVLDRDGHVLDLNPTAQGLVRGGTRDDAPERSVFDLLEAETAQTVRGHLEAAFQGQVRRFEIPFQRDDGSKGINAVLYAPVREEGVVRRVLALVRDVSDQRRTEAQLAQAEKLAAMGQLVSGVAHEINNPAAIISGFAQTLLLDELPTDQREMVTMIRDEAGRIGRITSNLLAFARAGGRERALVDINDIVRRTFALRSYYLSTLNITVRLELDAAEPKTWANGSELQQLLLNLLINAEQALMQVPPPRGITLRSVATEEEIRLVCGDTGPGIPAEIKGKIFDPFFTTKPEGVGTGLGLSICYGIARDHGGRIGVESDPGAGATFTVVLPRDPRTTPRVEPATAVPAAATGALSVLLVDDEAGLRKAVAKFLRRRGIHVETVGDGAEALTLLARRTFDVIVSDVRMPGVGGREFLDRLKQEHPHLVRRLIFSTGDTFAPDTAILLRDAAAPSIVKPFDFDQLEQLIRRVAGGGEAAAG
jgi:two-component system NtrC family sensor kinase